MGKSEMAVSRLVWALALAAIAAHVVAFDAAAEQDVVEFIEADDGLPALNKLHLQNARLSAAIRQLEAGGSITAAASSGRAAANAAGVTAGASKKKAQQDCKAVAIKETMLQVKPIMRKFMQTTKSLSKKYKRVLKMNTALKLKAAGKRCPKPPPCPKCKSDAYIKLQVTKAVTKAVKAEHAKDKLRYLSKKKKLQAQMKDMYFKDTDTIADIRKKNKKLIALVHANGAHFVAQVNAAKYAAKAEIRTLHAQMKTIISKARVVKQVSRVRCRRCATCARVAATGKKSKKSVKKAVKKALKKKAKKKAKKKLKKLKKKLKKKEKKEKKKVKKDKKAVKKDKKKLKKKVMKVNKKARKVIKKATKKIKKDMKKAKKEKKKVKKDKKKLKKDKKKKAAK